MASLRRDVMALMRRLAADHGCTVTINKSGHYRVTRPGYSFVTVSTTPTDRRALSNIKRDLRRHLHVDI